MSPGDTVGGVPGGESGDTVGGGAGGKPRAPSSWGGSWGWEGKPRRRRPVTALAPEPRRPPSRGFNDPLSSGARPPPGVRARKPVAGEDPGPHDL